MNLAKKLLFVSLFASFTLLCQGQIQGDYSEAETKLIEIIDSINQLGTDEVVTVVELPDSFDVARLERKSFWRASSEVVGFNLGLWAFDRYIQKGHYAYISWNTIKENFRHGFEWDDDHLGTNMFAHPYNGSLFYNAGRSNGYNFWQSTLFAIGGSAMWEMFMECEYPSTNDIIATPIGGAAIGEVLYRSSDLVLDDRTSGGERIGRELAAFVISPMRGFTRLITGRSTERRSTSGRRFGIPPIRLSASVGAQSMSFIGWRETPLFGAAAQINVEYGDRFAPSRKHPYDYFSFLLGLNVSESQPLLNRVEIIGRLISEDLVDKRNLKMSLGLYQHFDYFDSDTICERYHPLMPSTIPYKFGTPASLGVGAMVRYQHNNSWMVDAFAHGNCLVIAGVLNDFYHEYNRDYSWGSGVSCKLGLEWRLINDKFAASYDSQLYQVYTKDRHDSAIDKNFEWERYKFRIYGSNSNSTFFRSELKAKYKIGKNCFLVGAADYYRRFSMYNDMYIEYENGSVTSYPVKESKQLVLQLMLEYNF